MIAAELKAFLKDVPDDAEVVYADMNFGGPLKYSHPETWEFTYEEGKVCIPSTQWEECD